MLFRSCGVLGMQWDNSARASCPYACHTCEPRDALQRQIRPDLDTHIMHTTSRITRRDIGHDVQVHDTCRCVYVCMITWYVMGVMFHTRVDADVRLCACVLVSVSVSVSVSAPCAIDMTEAT